MNSPLPQQPYMVPQMVPVPVSTMQSAPVNNMAKYKSHLINLGITEIVLGVICIVCDILVLIFYFDIGQGIWCGSVLLACGIVGATTRPTPCMYNANMAMSIISALFMCTLVSLSLVCAIGFYFWPLLVALHSVMAITSFVALIVNIVHSAYCCAGICGGTQRNQVMMPVQIQQMNYPTANLGTANPVMFMPSSHLPLQVLSATNPGESSSIAAFTHTSEPPTYSDSTTKTAMF